MKCHVHRLNMKHLIFIISQWLTLASSHAKQTWVHFSKFIRPVCVYRPSRKQQQRKREEKKSYFQTNIHTIFRCYVTNERFKLLKNVYRTLCVGSVLSVACVSLFLFSFFFLLIKICHMTRSHVFILTLYVMFQINNAEPNVWWLDTGQDRFVISLKCDSVDWSSIFPEAKAPLSKEHWTQNNFGCKLAKI